MRAVVFVRRTGAKGAGHVGWAFECGDGTFNVGSIENPRHSLRTRPSQMGFWAERIADPIAPMRSRAYTHFKLIDVAPANPGFAGQVVAWLGRRPYDLFGHNCMNATYDVLRAFGLKGLPAPAHHWEPNHWFNHVRGCEYGIGAHDVILDLHSGARDIDVDPVSDAASIRSAPFQALIPAQPRWRIPHTPEWHALQREMAAAPPMPYARRAGHFYAEHIAEMCRWLGWAARRACSRTAWRRSSRRSTHIP